MFCVTHSARGMIWFRRVLNDLCWVKNRKGSILGNSKTYRENFQMLPVLVVLFTHWILFVSNRMEYWGSRIGSFWSSFSSLELLKEKVA